MEVCLRVVRDRKGVLVVICDAELLGKTFREGKMKLEVTKEFYGGTLCAIEKAMDELAHADMANLVGRDAIGKSIRQGLVDPEAVIYFEGVPHVQIVRL